jgi:hypothetical protein
MMLLVWMMVAVGGASVGMGEEQRSALLKQYWGKIRSIRIDKCGKRPGLCEGAITLAQRQGGEVILAIRPGTWIKRGDRLVLIEELREGNDVHVQAIAITGEGAMRATTIDVSPNP